jgi:hypothetical protein
MVWSTKINPVSTNLDLDQNIDGMLSSFAWDATAFFVAPWSPGIVYKEPTITYSFPDSMLDYGSNYSNEPRSNFAALNPAQRSTIDYMVQNLIRLSTGVSQKFPTVIQMIDLRRSGTA